MQPDSEPKVESISDVILIGPIGAGKSTLGKLLAEKLGLPQRPMDVLRWDYYREIGYDEDLENQFREKGDRAGLYDYWKPFEAHAVERLLSESRNCVIDFGAGHSVYDDPEKFERIRRILEPYANVVLLLPSPDPEESARILRERTGTKPPENPDEIDFVKYFANHRSNRALAKHIVYTAGKTPEETRDEIIERLGLI
jgi:shikimate kinase